MIRKKFLKILLLLSLFLNTLLFANALNNISYRDGSLNLKFENSVTYTEDFDKETPSLTIQFDKTSQYKSNIEQVISVNDKYISDFAIDYYNGVTTVIVYFQTGTKYRINKRSNDVLINFEVAETLPKRKYTIILDAGHGGHDSGAIGNGYREKDLALAVILQLYEDLKRDYTVILTRNNDTFIPLNERANIGNKANANLFVSVHLNSATNKSANGAEVYYFEKNPSTYARDVAKYENSFDEEGTRVIEASQFVINDILYGINQRESSILANTVLNNLVNTFPIRKRKVDGANFAVLRGSKSPSILVELGFITNYNDVRFFTSEEGQRRAASAIADAIRKHY